MFTDLKHFSEEFEAVNMALRVDVSFLLCSVIDNQVLISSGIFAHSNFTSHCSLTRYVASS